MQFFYNHIHYKILFKKSVKIFKVEKYYIFLRFNFRLPPVGFKKNEKKEETFLSKCLGNFIFQITV